jgi:hypothetical protein
MLVLARVLARLAPRTLARIYGFRRSRIAAASGPLLP